MTILELINGCSLVAAAHSVVTLNHKQNLQGSAHRWFYLAFLDLISLVQPRHVPGVTMDGQALFLHPRVEASQCARFPIPSQHTTPRLLACVPS